MVVSCGAVLCSGWWTVPRYLSAPVSRPQATLRCRIRWATRKWCRDGGLQLCRRFSALGPCSLIKILPCSIRTCRRCHLYKAYPGSLDAQSWNWNEGTPRWSQGGSRRDFDRLWGDLGGLQCGQSQLMRGDWHSRHCRNRPLALFAEKLHSRLHSAGLPQDPIRYLPTLNYPCCERCLLLQNCSVEQ